MTKWSHVATFDHQFANAYLFLFIFLFFCEYLLNNHDLGQWRRELKRKQWQ